jgi:hypothetical protein
MTVFHVRVKASKQLLAFANKIPICQKMPVYTRTCTHLSNEWLTSFVYGK